MPPPVITLTTDFGLSDEFAGVMKGVIVSICPDARIVDISHQVEPQDILQAAYLLEAAYPYFPKGTVHVVVVDPGVGTGRNILAASAGGHLFLAPDNGVLWPVLAAVGIEAAVWVTQSAFFLSPVSGTFHGRDIFAPVAAHLANGTALSLLGKSADPARISRLEVSRPQPDGEGTLTGRIVGVDRFGNLVTDIRREDIGDLGDGLLSTEVCVFVKNERIRGIAPSYLYAGQGSLLALFGSRGRLEIALSCGNAAVRLGAGRGDTVRVVRSSSPVTRPQRKNRPEEGSGRKDSRPRRSL